MSDDPRLEDLEIELVTITRDETGLVTVDGGGLSNETVSHLLLVGAWVHSERVFTPEDDDT